MANNCLETTLKATVNNDSLLKAKEMRILIHNRELSNSDVYLVFGNKKNVWTPGFMYSKSDEFSTYSLQANGWINFTPPVASQEFYEAVVTDKYVISINNGWYFKDKNDWQTLVRVNQMTELSLGATHKNGTIAFNSGLTSLTELNDYPFLTAIDVSDSILQDDVALLLPVFGNTLKKISVSGTLECSTATLGKFKALTKFPNTLGSLISGDLEDFVAQQVKLGNTEKTLPSVFIGGNGRVKFNNAVVSSAASYVLSWSASGNNTAITLGSSSTTIHVNNDGTWERVS